MQAGVSNGEIGCCAPALKTEMATAWVLGRPPGLNTVMCLTSETRYRKAVLFALPAKGCAPAEKARKT